MASEDRGDTGIGIDNAAAGEAEEAAGKGACPLFLSSVTSNGLGEDEVAVTFYDRRDDASNCQSHVYGTVNTDGGIIRTANVKLTTVSSSFDGNANGPGDYSSSAFFGSSAWPFFSDHRAANFEIYTAPILIHKQNAAGENQRRCRF